MEIGLLVLRVALGLTLAAHGAQKLFGWFGGYGLRGTGQWLESIGMVPGRVQALFAGLAEAGGGLLLALGLLTPFAAGIVVAVMLVAAVTVHLKAGFWLSKGGYEYNLVLALAALSLAFTGAGPLSLDAALGLPFEGARWGLIALAAGVVGGALPLAARRHPQPTPQSAT
jgi:putative oxidoreductase